MHDLSFCIPINTLEPMNELNIQLYMSKCFRRDSLHLWCRIHKALNVHVWEWKGREDGYISVFTVHVCVYILVWVLYCDSVCVGPLYTALGAKTLEIALIWIPCVSSNHNHVTSSPRQQRLIHGVERRSCSLLPYIHFTRMFMKWLRPQVPQKHHDANKYTKRTELSMARSGAHPDMFIHLHR